MQSATVIVDSGFPVGETNRENAALLRRAAEAGLRCIKAPATENRVPLITHADFHGFCSRPLPVFLSLILNQ
jgi:hypothetical protein